MNDKVKVDVVSSFQRKLTIEISTNDIESEMEQGFDSLAKKVKLKGFREGRVPMHVIRQQFTRQVKGDTLSKLIDKTYAQAISDHKIFPVNHPKIDMDPHINGKPFKYVAHVEIKPDIEPKKYTGLSIEREKVVIEENQVDQTIEQIRQSKAQLKNVTEARGVTSQDNVVMDFKGLHKDKVFPGGTAKNFLYEMGSNKFVPGFEEGLTGMKE